MKNWFKKHKKWFKAAGVRAVKTVAQKYNVSKNALYKAAQDME